MYQGVGGATPAQALQKYPSEKSQRNSASQAQLVSLLYLIMAPCMMCAARSAPFFRRLLKRLTGLPPGQYRRMFHPLLKA